ncbi:EAL domain-containing protein [Henriciella barbarensis]|uniref:EAL domain-containing protein n=1 Tax=Henriciella barbarensis TaxID=86342 RepID=A0A399QXE6_9PROT|nr:EAL domain-containing protein [Henriciella barbarensis]RIJ22172.1 EAL domain-containing protein [Henriciella barbarensis]
MTYTLSDQDVAMLERRALRERQSRKAAEKILEQKSLELFSANTDLKKAKENLRAQIEALQVERDRVLEASRVDHLTGLANRTAFFERLVTALLAPRLQKTSLKLLLVDLRRFKSINARVGQYGGDLVLKAVAARLQQVADEASGFAARFGGNEFALCVELPARHAFCYAQHLQEVLHQPIEVLNRQLTLDVAIGAAGTNTAGSDIEGLRRAADFAMQKARALPVGGVCAYDSELKAEASRRHDLEILLRKAIKKNEIEPWFQPIIDPRDPSKLSFEVLARWMGPDGFVAPMEFIPLAEELGLRRRLDRYLLQRACELAKPWIDDGWLSDISVNVSPSDLMSPDFVRILSEVLEQIDFPRDRLVIEVTESVFIEDLAFARSQLDALHALGLKVALDDFGTGYSNLRSLVGLPLSKIKLDRSLISDLDINDSVAMLISTITQWARAINLTIVAEGVETENQLTVLKALGCTNLQGYLFGKAQCANDIEVAYQPKKIAV